MLLSGSLRRRGRRSHAPQQVIRPVQHDISGHNYNARLIIYTALPNARREADSAMSENVALAPGSPRTAPDRCATPKSPCHRARHRLQSWAIVLVRNITACKWNGQHLRSSLFLSEEWEEVHRLPRFRRLEERQQTVLIRGVACAGHRHGTALQRLLKENLCNLHNLRISEVKGEV